MISRSEQTMFNLILKTAKNDERIRAVAMNGSRADLSAEKDCFQDYDITYVVTKVNPFVSDHSWINVFGEIMILQMPEDWHNHPYDYDSNRPFNYLMQFMDGTRIDLTICTIDQLDDEGEPMVALLDKDGRLPIFPEPTGECYHVKRPAEKEFIDCCNEFWWLCPYVAKELWRNSLPFAKLIFEKYIRSEFMKMINWYIGVQYNFKVGTGKGNKNLKKFLIASEWELFLKTYADLDKENIWSSLFSMCDMFRNKAILVAESFRYPYPMPEDQKVTEFIKHIKQMPDDSSSIY